MFQALWKLNDRHAADRAAPRQPRGRAAPPGRGGDGGGQAARRGRDLLARSRHRLGRGRSGDPGRRAEGRLAPVAARRPRQPPDGRGHRAPSWCRPTGSRCWSARPPCSASRRASWTAIRPGPAGSTCWRSICCWPGVRARRSTPMRCTPKSTGAAPYAAPDAQRFRRRAGLRRGRRLRARRLRPLAQAVPRQRGPRARPLRARRAAARG